MKISKCINIIIIITLILTMGMINKTFAIGSFSVSVSNSNVTVGEKVTITITGNNAYGKVNVSASSGTLSATEVFLANDSKTVILTTSTAGVVNINVSPAAEGLGDIDENPITESKSATITVKENVPTPEPTPTPDPTPTPKPEQEKEPSFKSTNQTVYATGDINLRSSWSTSSSATRVSKDTEMTLTGTSSEKINGYIWYRVSYNGQTKYVASSLVTTTKPEDEDEKTNANLKSLEVEGFSISPSFSASTLEYTMQVEMDTEKLKVNAQAESEKATVKIEGNETIVEGENIVKVIVTAEDGTTTKPYTIKVTKQEKVFGLKSLNIKDTDISDMFKTDVYEYSINIKNIDQLDIEAIATEEDATIEILGNENLQEGENIITIIVTSKDEKNTITYQIKATKSLVTEQQTEAKTIDKMSIIYAVVGGLALIALVIVVIYTIKHRKQSMHYNNEDDFDYYPENSEEKDEYYPEDLPEKKVKQDVDIQEESKELNDEKAENNDKANYFLEDPEEWGEYKNKNRKGKHF